MAGSLGAPVFAGAKAGSLFSPTGGYILGYIVSTIILGYLADKGVTKSYVKTILSLMLSSCDYFDIRCISAIIIRN